MIRRLLLIGLIAAIHPRQLLVRAQVPGQLVWSEDFSGSQLDPTWWSYDIGAGGWGNDELQEYTQGSVSVGSGMLQITASEPSDGVFHSGRIHTRGKFAYRYGRLVARIRLPTLNEGLWPAFWTMGQNFGNSQVAWPDIGEIDIMEMGQGLAITQGMVNHRVISAAHWEHEGNYAHYADWQDSIFPIAGQNAFHTFTLEWTPTYLRTYMNEATDDPIFEMLIDSGNCPDCSELHNFHYLILNLAVGGRFTVGEHSSSSAAATESSGCVESAGGGCQARTEITAPLPAAMEVDYVQLYANEYTEIIPPIPAPAPQLQQNPQVLFPTPAPAPQLQQDPQVLIPTLAPAPQLPQEPQVLTPTPNLMIDPQIIFFPIGKGKGKGGKGKGGKGKGKGGKGKGGKGKGGGFSLFKASDSDSSDSTDSVQASDPSLRTEDINPDRVSHMSALNEGSVSSGFSFFIRLDHVGLVVAFTVSCLLWW